MSATQRLHAIGQSLWIDNVSRGLLQDGSLGRYIADFLCVRQRTEWRGPDAYTSDMSSLAHGDDRTGHLPRTRLRLSAILERATQGNGEFTLQERVFVTACEFWVLAMGRELHGLTNLKALGKLRFAAMVYDAIGAVGVAGALQAAHGDLIRLKTQAQRRMRLMLLEERLLLSRDPMDEMLAELADNLASTELITRPGGTRPAGQSPVLPSQ